MKAIELLEEAHKRLFGRKPNKNMSYENLMKKVEDEQERLNTAKNEETANSFSVMIRDNWSWKAYVKHYNKDYFLDNTEKEITWIITMLMNKEWQTEK